MADSDNKEKLSLGDKKPLRLGLKSSKDGAGARGGAAARGGGRGVQVEVKRKRAVTKKAAPSTEAPAKEASPAATSSAAKKTLSMERPAAPVEEAPQLSNAELEARARALAEASEFEEERKRQEEEEQKRREEEAARRRAETEALQRQAESEAAQRRAEEEKRRRQAEEEERAQADAKAAKRAEEEEQARLSHIAKVTSTDIREEVEEIARRSGKGKPAARGRGENRRGSRRMTVTEALHEPEVERTRSIASMKRQRARAKSLAKSGPAPTKVYRDVIIPESITVALSPM